MTTNIELLTKEFDAAYKKEMEQIGDNQPTYPEAWPVSDALKKVNSFMMAEWVAGKITKDQILEIINTAKCRETSNVIEGFFNP